MKRIICGRKYDTDTAEFIGSDGGSRGNLKEWEESLYRKSSGEFFLHGEGGPLSAYAEYVDGSGWTWSEKIIPLTLEAAMAWGENHMTVSEYEEVFGEVSE